MDKLKTFKWEGKTYAYCLRHSLTVNTHIYLNDPKQTSKYWLVRHFLGEYEYTWVGTIWGFNIESPSYSKETVKKELTKFFDTIEREKEIKQNKLF